MLKRGEISIRRAVEPLREKKNPFEETSPKEAKIEVAKACTVISKEITPKIDQTAEIVEAAESEEKEILELMPGTIKSEIKKAFERLEDILGYELEDPEDRQRLR